MEDKKDSLKSFSKDWLFQTSIGDPGAFFWLKMLLAQSIRALVAIYFVANSALR